MWSSIKNTAGAALIAVLCVLLYWPRPARAPAPATPAAPVAPYCDDVKSVMAATEATPKTCSPACKAPQVCIDGTCCLPAVSHSPGSSAAFAWVPDSLR